MIGILKKLGFNLKNKKIIYLIESEKDEDFVIESLEKEKYIGIDTEFNWRNTYFPALSLLQISTSSKILLIDCLKFKKLGFLKKILEDKAKTAFKEICSFFRFINLIYKAFPIFGNNYNYPRKRHS